MKYNLTLTPAGHLLLLEGRKDERGTPGSWMKGVATAFSSSQPAGLFSFAAVKPDTPLTPVFSFWRGFACRYLAELCRIPEFTGDSIDPIDPPHETVIADLLASAPPMRGGEYLSAAVLRDLWVDLDTWVRKEIAASKDGLSGWLKKYAPSWHQVGRVCFHLVENKRDSKLPFAFLATYAPGLSREGRVLYQPLGKALQECAGKRNNKTLVKLLTPVFRASEKVDFVKKMVDSGEIFHPLAWSPAEAYRFLKNVPFLEESGLLIRLPDWWRKRPRPRVSVTIGEKEKSRFGADALLDFTVSLVLDGKSLTAEEWRKLMAAEDGLVYLKGQWVEVDRAKLSEVLEHWKKVEASAAAGGISFIEGMRLLAGAPSKTDDRSVPGHEEREWSFVDAGKWLSGILSGLRNPEGLVSIRHSRDFRGTLRPYQETGHNWLWFLSHLGLGACLADDMGLGKTVQVLSLLLALKEEKKTSMRPSLLVLPASLLANWKAELQRFAPALRASYIHPSEMEKSTLASMAAMPGETLVNTDVVLTTYGMLLKQKWLLQVDWQLVVLDEAQAIKNSSTRQAKTVKKLKAESRIALTGTPIENRLSDLWSLFDFLCPGLLGSTTAFKEFVASLEKRKQDQYASLRNLVRPYILRRLKTDKNVITDLPDKTEMKAFCGLSRKQAMMYTHTVEELSRALEGLAGMKRRGLVLSYLLKFKQICNHPSQLLGDGKYDPAESGKFNRLREICEEISSRQEKALVFTQFREMTGPVAAFLADIFGREGLILHGGTEIKKRKWLIDTFQEEDGPPFFVLSLKAGGTGLNLTAASHVIHFDRWWNPAVENQATDRAFRIGQKKNVIIQKFVCRGTIEEKIDALIEEKKYLAGDILETGAESLLTEMSDEELLKVVALDIERIGI